MELKILVRAVNHLQIPTAQKGSSQCVCVCVTLGVIGMLLHLFYRRGPGILLLTWSNKARQQDGILELATPAYLHFSAFFPHGMRLSPEPHWLQT